MAVVLPAAFQLYLSGFIIMLEMTKRETRIAYAKLIASTLIWGGSFIATKIVVQEISPPAVVWLRFLIGTAILAFFAKKENALKIESWRDGWILAGLGFIGITLHQWLQSQGLVTSEATTTAWIVSTNPVFIALFGWLLLKEKMSMQTIGGILMATFGVLLVVTKGDVISLLSAGFGAPGDILILISSPNWALYTVLSKPILKRTSALKVTFYTLLFGWLLSSVQFFSGGHWADYSRLSPGGWAAIIFLGVFCSAVAYIFYNDGMQKLTTSQVAIFLYLEPVFSTIVAAVMLSERITLATFAGGAFIILGVWLVNKAAESLAQ